MIVLIVFAVLAGIVTVLSPCILPLLPIILSASDSSGKQRPLGVVLGFIASFTFFTLFLSTIVRWSGIPADALRVFSILVLVVFGASLLWPQLQARMEGLFSRFANRLPMGKVQSGFWGGILVGLSLGLLWTPCVGPILAAVISLAITGTVTTQTVVITLAYALGTALPMLGIMFAGQTALKKVPWLVKNTALIQKVFGIVMILTGVGIFFNIDRRVQTVLLTTFPQYGVGLTRFEDTAKIKNELQKINQKNNTDKMIGKSMTDITQPQGVVAPELVVGGQWFNSPPLKLADLKGKVVLIDFWTYSCINCQRTLPYLRTWWEKYQDKGFVIIGVHSPEFAFEKEPRNVSQALQDFQLTYPVMQDNDFATWKAYDNHYWPAKYLVDATGRIRYTHFGEGEYDATERMIQQLLSEAGASVSSEKISNAETPIYSRTPELYLGANRIEYLASPQSVKENQPVFFSAPSQLSPSSFAYVGNWTLAPEYASPAQGAQLKLNFESKEVYLVVRPKTGSSTMKVYLDGQLQAFGADNHNGIVTVDKDRLYRLITLPQAGQHELTIEFQDDNSEVFAFTFG